jgi:hypothetical protein
MPLLRCDMLEAVVDLLNRRGAYFYHACQLKDFATYVQIGGIPSRHLMQRSNLPYTGFETDATDHNNGVWPNVFGNLSDFGQGFAVGQWSEGKAPTPNPYGPILLVAFPSILLSSHDVAICLRSAGGRDFNRNSESLFSEQEVNRLFVHPVDAPDPKCRAFIKYSAELSKEFGNMYAASGHAPSTYSPEISCNVPSEYLPFSKLSHIIVDRYYIHGRSLISMVAQIAFPGGLRVEIRERNYRDGRFEILSDLLRFLSQRVMLVKELSTTDNITPATRDWAQRLIAEGLDWQYKRFATYLREGTLT